jgi:hypothetical protein
VTRFVALRMRQQRRVAVMTDVAIMADAVPLQACGSANFARLPRAANSRDRKRQVGSLATTPCPSGNFARPQLLPPNALDSRMPRAVDTTVAPAIAPLVSHLGGKVAAAGRPAPKPSGARGGLAKLPRPAARRMAARESGCPPQESGRRSQLRCKNELAILNCGVSSPGSPHASSPA